MTITTLTLKEHHSGGGNIVLNSYNCFLSVHVSVTVEVVFFFSSACVSSVGVALSRGHGKYFFRGNISVEAGTSFQPWHLLKALIQ